VAATILIVDDDEHLRVLVNTILTKEGYRVIEADSGKSCLELLFRKKPDLIVMEVMLPTQSGFDIVKRIRENRSTKNAKVVFLSVVAIKELDKKVLNGLKAQDYIEKPFDNDDFVKRVFTALKSD